jgi:hypothetical protein
VTKLSQKRGQNLKIFFRSYKKFKLNYTAALERRSGGEIYLNFLPCPSADKGRFFTFW